MAMATKRCEDCASREGCELPRKSGVGCIAWAPHLTDPRDPPVATAVESGTERACVNCRAYGSLMTHEPCRSCNRYANWAPRPVDVHPGRFHYVPIPDRPGALDQQVGGDHYKGLTIQPVEFIHRNGIGYMEGNVIKYLTRWRNKGGVEDLRKARHYIDLLIEMEVASGQ